jgi:hypothetical protein
MTLKIAVFAGFPAARGAISELLPEIQKFR